MRDQPCSGQVKVLEMNGRTRTKSCPAQVMGLIKTVRVKGLENLFLQIVTIRYVILAGAIATRSSPNV